MKKIAIPVLMALIFHSSSLLSQNYLQDAKYLLRYQQLYKLNKTKVKALKSGSEFSFGTTVEEMDLSGDKGMRKLAELVLSESTSTGLKGATGGVGNQSGNAVGSDLLGFEDAGFSSPEVSSDGNSFSKMKLDEVMTELNFYKAFAETNDPSFEIAINSKSLNDFPCSFKYLEATISVLENDKAAGIFTGGAIGSLLGISQAEILKGITDWAIKRAQEELLQSFLRNWMETIQEDRILRTMFPNTLNMLSTSELTTFFTDGDTWKATFQQDLDAIAFKIPAIADTALSVAGNPVGDVARYEIIDGLSVMVDLFGELGKGKKPDEIFLLLGDKSYLRNSINTGRTVKSTIDRSMVATGSFLTALAATSNDGGTGYVHPKEIYKLTDEEAQAYWRLFYLCQRDKLKFSFNLKNETEADFYNHVTGNIQKFKLKIGNVSEDINAIISNITVVKNSGNKEFNFEQFNKYVLLVFDMVENGVDIIGELHGNQILLEEIKVYKSKYLEGFRHASFIHEGVITKNYGKVALNSVNLLLWIKDCTIKDRSESLTLNLEDISNLKQYKKFTASIPPEQKASTDMVLMNELKSEVKAINADLPSTERLLNQKLKMVNKDLARVPKTDEKMISETLQTHITFNEQEKRVILNELTQPLVNSSEATNKYTKLMSSILLAENSEDIKFALENAAMKTGGYMVRQKSQFSASLTFYPGIEAGGERIQRNGQSFSSDSTASKTSSLKGSYVGAALPIGIEMAMGTNWRPIGSVGLFLQVLDLGSVLNYSLSNNSDSVMTLPEFGFVQVLSPGAFLTVHLANNPITFGAGVSFAPELREINVGGTVRQASALQYGAFLTVDLNVLQIYASKKKFPLKSKSMQKTYE